MEYPFKDLMPLDEVLEREGYYRDWTHLDPEVFYSLTQISEYIKTKGYGVDVRLLIAQLAEHFGLKTTQVVDLANLLQQKFTNLEGVTQSFTNNINSLVAQMEADKDAVIANATVDSEVILARGGKATLGARLDDTTAQLAQNVTFSNQTNFVDVLKNMQSFNRMRVAQVSAIAHNILLDDGFNFIEYQFIKDDNDDFIKLNKGVIGILERFKDTGTATSLTGSWVTSTTNHYTTEIGATFTCTVKGSELILRHNVNNRGGVWEFVIDGNEDNKIRVSTFSHKEQSNTRTIIAEDLADVEHTIVGTFIGADPKNPPNGGTPRGWIYVQPSSPESTITGYGNPVKNEIAELLATASNKEFAIRVGQDGQTTHWIPDHGTGTAFNARPPIFMLDGKEVDFTFYSNGYYLECDSFKLSQDIYGKLPYTNNLLRLNIEASIDKNGVVNFIANLVALEDFWVTAGYPAMLPTPNANLNEFITGIGNYQVNTGDETEKMFEDEKNLTHSAVAVSQNNTDWFAAVQVEAPGKSMRLGKEGTPNENESMFLWHRANTPKVYFRAYTGHNMEAGESYSWASRFLIGKAKDVYGFVKS